MNILGIDSAGNGCSACIWSDGKIIAGAEETMERGQDQRLMPLIMEILAKAGLTFDQLDRIAVTRGPGSFTGLRIGLAAARGIGLASGKPVIGIDRFSIFREQMPKPNLLVAIHSKRKELYCQYYAPDAQPATMMTPDEINAFLKAHPDTCVAGDVLEMTPVKTNEVEIAASLAARANPSDPAFVPSPLYIRAPDVTIAKK